MKKHEKVNTDMQALHSWWYAAAHYHIRKQLGSFGTHTLSDIDLMFALHPISSTYCMPVCSHETSISVVCCGVCVSLSACVVQALAFAPGHRLPVFTAQLCMLSWQTGQGLVNLLFSEQVCMHTECSDVHAHRHSQTSRITTMTSHTTTWT